MKALAAHLQEHFPGTNIEKLVDLLVASKNKDAIKLYEEFSFEVDSSSTSSYTATETTEEVEVEWTKMICRNGLRAEIRWRVLLGRGSWLLSLSCFSLFG